MKYISLIFFAALLGSCKKNSANPGLVDALVPVYGSQADLKVITQQPPQPIDVGGKIATIGNYLFQVEEGMGIHVFNIANPAVPQKLSFIKIPLCNEVTLKGNFLYTNNANDLVVLNISNISNIAVSSRIENAFPLTQMEYPNQRNVYFECPDKSKGPIVKWEMKKVNNPKCKR